MWVVSEDRGAGELVRELRRLSRLSQRELGERAGTSGPTIAAYESGTKEPRISTLDRLAACVGHELVTELRPSGDSASPRQTHGSQHREPRAALPCAARRCGRHRVVDLVVIGSQAVLGTFEEWRLPIEATRSVEADIAVDLATSNATLDRDESG